MPHIIINEKKEKRASIEIIEVIVFMVFNFLAGFYMAQGNLIIPILFLITTVVVKVVYTPAMEKKIILGKK